MSIRGLWPPSVAAASMKRFPYVRSLRVAAVVCLAAACAIAAETVVEEIVARVNNSIITRSELQRSHEQLLSDLRQQNIPDTDARATDGEKDLLRDLIDQQLLLQKGQDLGINADTELIKKLDEVRKQMHLADMEALEKAAQQQGVSYEEFKQNMENGIITQEVIQKEVGQHINVTAEEQNQFYEEHKSEMTKPEQVRLREILITPQTKPGEETSPVDLAAAEQKADQALAEIKAGKSFNEVAQKYSNGPSAAEGGDLGYFKRGALAKELEDETFAMKPGEVTGVTRTKQGFVILKVDDHTSSGVPAFAAVKPQIEEQLYLKKLQPALRVYLTKLREDAFIDVRPGYVDTGQSPNQTQPVITDATPTPAKTAEKKKKKFLLF